MREEYWLWDVADSVSHIQGAFLLARFFGNPLIGEANQRLIDEADVIFAVLDGVDVDSGTAAEIGYGFAKAKKILGYRGDFRPAGDNEGASVNLQVEYFIRKSGGAIITTIDDLPKALENCALLRLGMET